MTISPAVLGQEALKRISRARLSLPPVTAQAVRHYLQSVSRVNKSQLKGLKSLEYRTALAQATKELLNNPNPNDLVKTGYRLAFKVLSSIHQEKEGDKSEQKRLEEIVQAIKRRVKSDRPDLQKTIDVFCTYYLQIGALQMFTNDGISMGRAQAAYLLALEELVAGRAVSVDEKFVRTELVSKLKTIAREEGHRLLKEEGITY